MATKEKCLEKRIQDDMTTRLQEKAKKWNKIVEPPKVQSLGVTFKSIEEKYAKYEEKMKAMANEIDDYDKRYQASVERVQV